MRKHLLVLIIALCATTATFAQVTTSSVSGTIKDAKDVLIGATIKATYVPSGTIYSTSTRGDGRYAIVNMRPGGPYLIEISYIGYQPQKLNDIYLKLGEPFVLNATLTETGLVLKDVTIRANNPQSVLNSDRSGSVTNISTREINTIPTIQRNINDLTRLTPQANGQSIGGGNSRQNNITIDGGNFNNAFGIGTNLPANGSPIPLDALEEISVTVNPVDVRQNNVIGAAINANTRSGTNTFVGSAYGYYRNENYLGTKVKDYAPLVPTAQEIKNFGFRLGGPIIKNKLFFFGNYEREKQQRVGSTVFASTPENPFPSTPNVRRPLRSELDEISNYLRSTYGYETGAYDGYNFQSERTNIVGRLDWNINSRNKFNVRYSQVESKTPSFVSTSTSPLVNPYPNGGSRGDNNALAYENSNYYTNYNFYSLSAELTSANIFGSSLSNTLRATYNKQNEPRSSNSAQFPFVDILRDGRPFTSFGYEPFTFGNLRDVKAYSFVDYVQTTIGKHNLLAGVQAELTSVINGFQRFGTSYYVFNSFDDFKNGAQPLSYAKTYSLSPGFEQAFPKFKTAQYSLYAQDDYNVTEKLRISFGIRANYYNYTQDLLTHPLVAALTFKNGETINTGRLPSSTLLFSPRFGFNYDVKGDRSFQIRGSASIVSGGIPNVWIVSQVGDAGLLQFTQIEQNINPNLTASDPASRIFNPNPNAYLPATPPAAGTAIPSSISVISPNIKAPQTFKANLAADFKLPFGFTGTIEGLYNRDYRTVLFRNPNLVDPTPLSVPGYADNRLFYPAATSAKYINVLDASGKAVPNNTAGASAFNVYELDNASQGYYWSVTAKLDKQIYKGLSASIAYVRSEAKTLFDGSGDQPSSSWQGTTSVNGSNNPELGFSSFVVPNRIIATVTYKKEYLKHLATTFSLIYEGANAGRVSYTYSTDFNRDGANADLIYIPKDPSEITFSPFTVTTNGVPVTYSAQQQSDLFFRFIEQDSYLNSRKGKYAERGGGLAPWFNQLDLNLLQDVFTNFGVKKRNSIQINLTIENFGNLLNKNWGVRRFITQSNILVPVNSAALVTGSATRPTFRLQFDGNIPTNTTFVRDDVSFNSTYRMQLGLRYNFN